MLAVEAAKHLRSLDEPACCKLKLSADGLVALSRWRRFGREKVRFPSREKETLSEGKDKQRHYHYPSCSSGNSLLQMCIH
jgi:hypothetical protein